MKHHHPSRKYKLALLALALITAGYIVTHFSDRLKDSYMLFIGGIGTVLSLYGAANVSNKWVLAKHGVLPTDPNAAPPPDPEASVNPNGKSEDISGA